MKKHVKQLGPASGLALLGVGALVIMAFLNKPSAQVEMADNSSLSSGLVGSTGECVESAAEQAGIKQVVAELEKLVTDLDSRAQAATDETKRAELLAEKAQLQSGLAELSAENDVLSETYAKKCK